MARLKKNVANHTLIVGAKRTPIVRICKRWNSVSAIDFGARVIGELLYREPTKALTPDQVIMGTLAKPREYLNPAKEACARADFSDLNAFTVNKVCSSGLLSVMLGNALIKSGEADCVVAGGMENLLNLPESTMMSLLQDPRTNEMTWHAGNWCSTTYGISRRDQDDWAVESYRKAIEAYRRDCFTNELVSFRSQEFDEEPFRKLDENMIRNAELIPGCTTITALNSSKNAGGAAAVMLTNKTTADKYTLRPLVQILSSASVALGGEMKNFTIAPPFAIRKALERAELGVKDIDLYFINTAFGSVTLHASRELGIPLTKININGDAVSFGHPIGATGAKLLVEAVWALKNLGLRYAVISLCNAPAEATAMVIEAL